MVQATSMSTETITVLTTKPLEHIVPPERTLCKIELTTSVSVCLVLLDTIAQKRLQRLSVQTAELLNAMKGITAPVVVMLESSAQPVTIVPKE
jgi:hypothetical protein